MSCVSWCFFLVFIGCVFLLVFGFLIRWGSLDLLIINDEWLQELHSIFSSVHQCQMRKDAMMVPIENYFFILDQDVHSS